MKRLGFTLAFLASPVLAGTAVFERADPVEVRTGVMKLRTVEGPLLEVPQMDGRTWGETRFARLYAIELELETRRREAVDQEDRGTLYIGVRTAMDALLAFDERLHALLASLAPDAFVSPLAGIDKNHPDLAGLAEISVEPSWVCETGAGRRPTGNARVFERRTEARPDGTTRVLGSGISYPSVEVAARVCSSIRLAAQGAAGDEIRTLPAPRELHERRVEFEEVSTLPRELRQDEVPSLPRGVEISKRKVPGAVGGGSTSPDLSRGTYIDREIEWVASTLPTDLSPELLARGAHVSRWTILERARRLGAGPKDEIRTVAVRTVAFLPIAPALLPEESLPPTIPVELNAELLRDDVPLGFEVASEVSARVLEWALHGGGSMDPQWLRSQGWMMVVCREDGTAWFGLPPTSAQSPLTNAPMFCAAMERMLP